MHTSKAVLDAQARLMLKAALEGDMAYDSAGAASLRQMIASDLPKDYQNAVLFMVLKALEANSQMQFILEDEARRRIALAIGDLPFSKPEAIDDFITQFLHTLSNHRDAWTSWAFGGHGRIEFMLRALRPGVELPEMTNEMIGEKVAQFADQGVITVTSLLRICALMSRLSQDGVDEDMLVGTLMLAWEHKRADLIAETVQGMQSDPMLAVREPKTFTLNQDALDGESELGETETDFPVTKTPFKFARTQRGFRYVQLVDAYGHEGGVQESSVATESLLWVGRDGSDRMHITQDQADKLAGILKYFAEIGELPDSFEALQD